MAATDDAGSSSSSSTSVGSFPYEIPLTLEEVQDAIVRIPSLVAEKDTNGVLRENWPSVQFANTITNRYSQIQRMKCKRKGRTDSPYDIYMKDKETYDLRIEQTRGNPRALHQIRKEILKKSPDCSLFPISRVVYLIKYLFGDDLSKIRWLDMSAGWGDRLIAAIALQLAKYQGTDPNGEMASAYETIISELANDKREQYGVETTGFEEYEIGEQEYDIAFTSPPFFDFEIYSDERTQSTSKFRTVREWTEDFMIPYARKALNALRDGGYLVLYIEQHEHDYVHRLFEEFGEPEILYMGYDDNDKRRPFYIWQKGVVREDLEEGVRESDREKAGVPAPPLPMLPPVPSGERPYAVLVLRAFGDLPVTGAFSLMCSGFLTDGESIPGSSISHVQEEKVREILGLDTEEEADENVVNVGGYTPLDHTDHRLAIEDLVRVLPLSAHVLLELTTLTSECVERIVRILIASGRKVVIYRVIREAMPEHFPRIRTSKRSRASVPTNSMGQERFVHITEEEYESVQNEITNIIGHLKDLGGNPQDLIFNPSDSIVRVNKRVCELLTRDHIRTRGTSRIVHDPRESLSEYVSEYKNGGSLREYTTRIPIRTGFIQELTPEEWERGDADTLVVEPMRIKSGGRSMNITSHTEIVVKQKVGEDGLPFEPLSWHRGDLRTIQIHHEPMNTNLRVL
jgi:hypothetical protein